MVVLERSTGTSTSILGTGLALLAAGFGVGTTGSFAGAAGLLQDLRMLSMEKLKFLVDDDDVVLAVEGLSISEASSRSVGVRGGEARREDSGERLGEAEAALNMSVSSVLIW